MIPLHSSLEEYKEGYSVPSIAWRVVLRFPPPSYDIDSGPQDINVSERLIGDLNIIDSVDYRENLTYINEVNLKLNNYDGFLHNDSGTGKLDSEEPVEVFIDGYFDVPGGSEHLIRKFGGWMDHNRSKADAVKKTIDVVAYSYLGKADFINGYHLTTRYLDDNGLILYTTQLWIRNAAVEGKELQKGGHYIYTKFDDLARAKLDDGEWTVLTVGEESELLNSDESESVIVFYDGFSDPSAEEKASIVIVKEISQYPETFFYYEPIKEIIKKCFDEIGITNQEIKRFEIPTWDSRKIISGSNRVEDTNGFFVPASIASNGEDLIYVSGSFTGSPNKNQIWEYNHTSDSARLIYETTLNNNTKHKLIWEPDDNYLIAFIDNKEEDEERGFIQRFTINEFGVSYTTLIQDSQFDTVNPYYRFHFSPFLKKFLFIGYNGSDKVIFEMDLNGSKSVIATDNDIELNGACWIYDKDTVVEFYYIKNVSGTRKVYKLSYSGSWSNSFVIDWFDNGDYNYWYPYQFTFEEKIYLSNFNETRLYLREENNFTENLNPANTKFYSPFEFDDKIYLLVHNTSTDVQKVASISGDTLSFESNDIVPYDIIKHPATLGFQHITNFFDLDDQITLAVLSKYPALMLRFSEKIIPFIDGEYDVSDKTIRQVLEELANNYLAFVRIDSYKKAWFIQRGTYQTTDIVEFKKFNKDRIKERMYSEKYDRIEVTNSRGVTGKYGDTGIDINTLQLDMRFIPDDLVKDMAKYFYDYYSVLRYIMKFNYLPTYYNWEVMDQADMSEFGLSTGRIHKVSPGKSICEFEILLEG